MVAIIAFFLAALLPWSNLAAPHQPAPQQSTSEPLNITTIAANDRNESTIECWSVAELQISNTPGIQGALLGSLGTSSGVNYFNIPAGLDGGLHNAPVVQYVWFTSGKAVISLPTSSETAMVRGGANGLILAIDIAAVSKLGHKTVYPSRRRTVGTAIALTNNTVPEHTVLHAGACTEEEGPELF
ncbi:MAG: hypothetical protein Q9191_008112 [Dirinaria sp. TL-2023a]